MAVKKIAVVLCATLGLTFMYVWFFCRENRTINLCYTLNYKGDSWQKNKTGLLWTLSYLGASLPEGSFDKSIQWIDSSTFTISFKELGFNREALEVLDAITDSVRQSAQYQKKNSISLAQFVTLTIGSSWHYYAITGALKSYEAYLNKHKFKNEQLFYVTHSTVAKHHRVVKFEANDSVLQSVFIAEEGEGDLLTNQFKTQYYEVLDVMPNGQLRFAVYDKNGDLTDSSPKFLGEAGKPAKCLWCHEIVFQPLFVPTDTLVEKMNPTDFQNLIARQNQLLSKYRQTLKSEIDFSKTQDHTLMELLYISYTEPSLDAISKEWGIDQQALRKVLRQQMPHQHSEFEFLDKQYYRKDIERYAPNHYLKLADDVREPSIYEPNYTVNYKK